MDRDQSIWEQFVGMAESSDDDIDPPTQVDPIIRTAVRLK